MGIVVQCAVGYLLREKLRTILVLLGLATAFGATALIYGAAGQIAYDSSRCLRWITTDADLWLVPPSGLRLDRSTGLIGCESRLPLASLPSATADSSARIGEWDVTNVTTSSGLPAVVYALRENGNEVAACGPELWAACGGKPFSFTYQGHEIRVQQSDPSVPPKAIAYRTPRQLDKISWITIKTSQPRLWLQSDQRYVIRDTLHLGAGPEGKPMLYPITTSASRFNAYSFDARFAALVTNTELNSALGTFARTVLVFGLLIMLSSSLFGLQEKAPLIAALTAYGITAEIIGVLLAEATILTFVAWLAGVVAAVAALNWSAIGVTAIEPLLEGIAMTSVFLPAMVLFVTLISSARLLSLPPARLIGRAF